MNTAELILVGLVASWLIAAITTTLLTFGYDRRARPKRRRPGRVPCVILSPVKGVSPTLGEFVTNLLNQDHTRYRVIFIVESERDPAYAALDTLIDNDRGKAELLVAGRATDRGQKVHNLSFGLGALTDDDRIVVFVDADLIPPPDWLTQLTHRIARGREDVTTGYTVAVPRSLDYASVVASLISIGIATCLSPVGRRLCWGGSTAIRKEALEALRPEDFLAQTVSDDLSLSRAAAAQGIQVHHIIEIRVPSPVKHSWPTLFAYLRRQYQIVRIYAPAQWSFAAAALLLPPFGLAASLALVWSGHGAAVATWVLVLALQQSRFFLRQRALLRLLDQSTIEKLRAVFVMQHFLGPVTHAVHLLAFLTSAAGRTITWAGISYRVAGPRRMVVLPKRSGKRV